MMIVDKDRGVELEVLEQGSGPDVVLLASALRPATDFALLQAALTKAGFRSLAVNMRGIGKSRGPEGEFTLEDIADDVAGVINQACGGRAHVVGHALGNIMARATAAYHPDLVSTVAVMPPGGHALGKYPVAAHVLEAFARCHDESLPDAVRLEALQIAFFAPGNDASSWLTDWWPSGAAISAAFQRVDPETWWRAGGRPILVIQPMKDAMAPPEVGREMAQALGSQVTYVEAPNCGHAILPEQPDLIADLIIGYLRDHAAA